MCRAGVSRSMSAPLPALQQLLVARLHSDVCSQRALPTTEIRSYSRKMNGDGARKAIKYPASSSSVGNRRSVGEIQELLE